MSYQRKWFITFLAVLGTATLLSSLCSAVHAQEPKAGKLKVYVTLPEAYTFVDEKAIGPGNQSIRLGEGKHTLSVENYGFKPFRQDISIASGETTKVRVDLKRMAPRFPVRGGASKLKLGPQPGGTMPSS